MSLQHINNHGDSRATAASGELLSAASFASLRGSASLITPTLIFHRLTSTQHDLLFECRHRATWKAPTVPRNLLTLGRARDEPLPFSPAKAHLIQSKWVSAKRTRGRRAFSPG